MSSRAETLRALRARRASKRAALQADYLAPVDQASFQMSRATGRAQGMQCVWIYERPVDLDGVRRFQQYFGRGLGGRLIEPSPLPFGRHRWVASPPPPTELDIAAPRPRSEFSDWLDERSQLPVDPEFGPGWHLGVLPMTDGSTAIALVGSHCLADGVGAVLQTVLSIKEETRDFGLRPPRSRSRARALAADARQTLHDVPVLARTLKNAGRLAYRKRDELMTAGGSPAATPVVSDDGVVVIPAVAMFVDIDEWDRKAADLGGNSYALLSAVGAKLGERMGRRHHDADDGGVTLLIAISDRTLDDTRAHAMEFVNVNVDPEQVTADLTETRARLRTAIKKLREESDEAFELLPLTPFVPKRAIQKLGDVIFGFNDLPVACSNLGDMDPTLGRLDGTDADYVMLWGVDQNVKRCDIERAGGQLVLVSARMNGRVIICITAYQSGTENSKARLRELATDTLAEFDLAGVIV